MTEELHVLFKVGTSEYGIPALQVAQMESWTGVTPIPGAAAHVAGIVQVRGRVVPVVDLRVRFGAPVSEATSETRLVIVHLGERQVALLVDGAREVVRLSSAQVQAPPPMLTAQSAGLVRAIAHVGTRMVMLVDADGLVGQEQVDGA